MKFSALLTRNDLPPFQPSSPKSLHMYFCVHQLNTQIAVNYYNIYKQKPSGTSHLAQPKTKGKITFVILGRHNKHAEQFSGNIVLFMLCTILICFAN